MSQKLAVLKLIDDSNTAAVCRQYNSQKHSVFIQHVQ